eukprot:1037278-Pleurochrysis_carterae.AAC.1
MLSLFEELLSVLSSTPTKPSSVCRVVLARMAPPLKGGVQRRGLRRDAASAAPAGQRQEVDTDRRPAAPPRRGHAMPHAQLRCAWLAGLA